MTMSAYRIPACLAALALVLAGLVAAPNDAHALSVLYDRSGEAAATITNSQNYEAALDTHDAEAADDFQVPTGSTWSVESISVKGQYSGNMVQPTSTNVRLYSDAGGVPGVMIQAWLGVVPNGGFGSPSYSDFTIPLASPPTLAAGHYWISVQADLASGSHWSWRNRMVTNLSPAAYRNPGGGWGTSCDAWSPRATTCAGGNLAASDPDQAFLLSGTSASTTPPADCYDAKDNDGDGIFDYPADRGCGSPADPSEAGPWNARVSLRYSRTSKAFTGTVSSYGACEGGRVVAVRKKGVGLVGEAVTERGGHYSLRKDRKPGTYFADLQTRKHTRNGDLRFCRGAESELLEIE